LKNTVSKEKKAFKGSRRGGTEWAQPNLSQIGFFVQALITAKYRRWYISKQNQKTTNLVCDYGIAIIYNSAEM
jgi:hypothetical protein